MLELNLKFFKCIYAVLFLLGGTQSDDNHAKYFGDVIFSNVIFRHGDRMPLDFYPNDPNKNAKWPFQLAQLSNIGKRQEYKLGHWLRQRYSHLLSSAYKSDEIYVASTDVDRTIMSAQCCLAGLFEPLKPEEWNPHIYWQPIPIHTVPLTKDVVLGAGATAPCALYDLETSRVEKSPAIKKITTRLSNMYKIATEESGMEVYDFKTAMRLYDPLFIEDMYNFSLPSWTSSVYPEPLREAALFSFVMPTWSPLQQRLKVGPLLGEIMKHFIEKRDGNLKPDRKLWMYSAHDMTIASVLNTFGSFDIQFPPYASSLLIELRLKNDKHYVTMFYRNSTTQEPYLLPILECNVLCPLDQFISLVQPFVPADWEEECNSVTLTASGVPSDFALLLIAVLFSSVILLLAFVVTCWIKKRPQNWYSNMKSSSEKDIPSQP